MVNIFPNEILYFYKNDIFTAGLPVPHGAEFEIIIQMLKIYVAGDKL